MVEAKEVQSAKRAELLRLLLGTGEPAPRLIPVARDGEIALSFSQNRLWVLEQLEALGSAYNIAAAVRMDGNLDVVALERAFAELVHRHEVLRTRFVTRDGQVFQTIDETVPFRLALVDLSSLDPAQRADAIRRTEQDEAAHRFDLAHGPLFRATLLRLSAEEHIILVTMHHIVSDGWSMSIVVREIGALYAAFVEGRSSPLAGLPVQYADFAVWQRRWLQGEVLDRQVSYWKARLAGAPPALELPTDRPRPLSQSYRGASCTFELPKELTGALAVLARQEGATLFMVLLAAFKVVLSRWSGQDDIVVGTPVAGRTHAETEDLIGFFINMLALRTSLTGDPDFRTLLRQVRDGALEAYAHQEMPFDRLVEEVRPARDLSRQPIFQTLVVLQNMPQERLELPGLTLRPVTEQRATAKFDLSLYLHETENGLAGTLEYATDLFEHDTIERLKDHYRLLLEGVVADPEQPISHLPMLTDAEQHLLFDVWNDTAADFPRDKLLHELFADQAALTPDAVAVIYDQQQLTYQELDRRSNQLAHHLQSLGVGPEVIVGLCVDRSPEMIVAMLAILKAGGAYLPLDPAYPRNRLAYMLRDAAAHVVVTRTVSRPSLPDQVTNIVDLDAHHDVIEACPDTPPASGADPTSLAYVIYTSGSTGQPKGVMIIHEGVVNLLVTVRTRLDFTCYDVMAALTPVTFDIAGLEFFLPLTTGAKLLVVPRSIANEGASLKFFLSRNKISTVQATPSTWTMLLSEEWLPNRDMKILCGGEAITADLVQYFSEHVRRAWNLYGPTETTIWSLIYPVTSYGLQLIGGPLSNTQVYVLDRHMCPVPIGTTGEIYIGGVGLARGYLNRPDLTAERFVQNPFGSGDRLYRTGDLGRWRKDGNLEFLGRADHQVKIRGFRIELGEVEAVLLSHPDVRQAVVIAHEDQTGDKRLVAYVVGEASPRDLRAHILNTLPDYMTPAAFVALEAMPLTTNGKIDRAALPHPTNDNGLARADYVAPRTPTEEILAAIWADVLQVSQVGVNDNFFELGGNSLLAMRMVARVRSVFNIELPLRSLFEDPRVVELGHRIEIIQRQERGVTAPRLIPVARDGEIALSFSQNRLWVLEQLEALGSAYNIAAAVRMDGNLDVVALERAFAELVHRHEVLRTRFVTRDGQVFQTIDETVPFRLALVDLSSLDPAQRADAIRRTEQDEAAHRFDLAHGPLFRATLLRLSAEEHIILVTMHHIVSDGWSMSIVVREIGALYAAFVEGRSSPLAGLPVQYADFAVWQRRWLQGEVLDRQVSYWKARLAGAPPALELPTDRPRPLSQSYRGASCTFELPKELTGALAVLARQEGATLFMVLLAAFKVVLSRWSGQDDIVVGTPVAGRTHAETEDLIGFFINMLALRTSLTGDPDFRTLLRQVRDGALEAYAHQEMPFDRLVEEVRPARDLSRQPIFQTLVVLQNMPQERLELPGLTLRPVTEQRATAKFDLSLYLHETENGLAGTLEYATDLFEHDTIERLKDHYRLLLEGVVADPEQPISHLPMLTDAEQHLLFDVWNDTAADFPRDKLLHELFADQAALTPDAVAVIYDQQQLTYQELDRRSNQLAHHLQSLGVGPEVIVGLCVDRSPEMIVAMLAILKAGGAYLPLDPAYPRNRLAYMLRDAAAHVVVTRTVSRPSLPDQVTNIVDLDAHHDVIEACPDTPPASGADPTSLAYVIYTSGSTGQPKGVMIIHEGVVNYITTLNRRYSLSSSDRVLQNSSISFDPSVRDIWCPLIAGAKLVVPHGLDQTDRASSLGFVSSAGVSLVLSVTPSALTAPVLEEVAEPLMELRALLTCGEALSYETCRLTRSRMGHHFPIVNQYGPTECTMSSTFFVVGDEPASGIVPIGRPIANRKVYVLDRHMCPVPIGTTGEIYIGGVGLARGYLNRPDLTAERFVQNPFGSGDRLYRTGDLGRWRKDGNLEFLGRADHQVKIRGFRIELGEVEAVLLSHPDVRQAVVIAHEDQTGDKRLVAYVVGEASPRDLRAHILNTLPDYMTPAAFVALEAMPLTTNGKIDRAALPHPTNDNGLARADYVAPRTPTEEILAAIWADVLQVSQVGVNDNFFELGGNSLLAMRMVARVRSVFNIELPLRSLFEDPRVVELGHRIEIIQRQERGVTAPRLIPVARDGEIALSFSQNRLWVLEQLEALGSAYNIAAAVRMDGNLDVVALERAFAELVHRHEVLRTRFVTRDGQVFQTIDETVPFRLALVDLSSLDPAQRADAIRRTEQDEAAHRFDLAHGPLFRATLLRLSAEEHIILVTMHHIVSDGWSMSIVVREIGALYAAFVEGRSSPLAGLPVQYADFAVWQRRWLQGEVLDRQVSYWKARLAGAPPALELPTDRPRPLSQSYRGASCTFELPKELTGALAVLARQEGATLFMVLLAAFKVVLSRWSGQDDIVVGTPVAGRTHAETEDLIGFFINMLALRTSLTGDPDFRTLLRQVRDGALEAYAHQEMPFDRLVEEVRPARDLSRQPIFQTLVVLQNMPQERLELPGLTLRPVTEQRATAKFDLSLYLHETENGLAGTLEYATDLFEHDTIERLKDHYRLLLEGVVADPEQPISHLPMLTDAEQHLLFDVWNDTAADFPRDKLLHELFADQAALTPDAVAVIYDQQQLTYQELDRRSNQLAHHLQSLGVGPEVIVGLCVDRSPEMIVAMLAILKAGGAYLPLDPAYPRNRLAYMLRDAAAHVVVTRTVSRPSLPDQVTNIVDLDAHHDVIEACPDTPPASGADPTSLAYVIYTSGSTGQPKGVMIIHEGVVNYITTLNRRYSLSSSDRVLQNSSISFDPSVRDIWCPLIAGAKLVVPHGLDQTDRASSLGFVSSAGVSLVLSVTPSALTAPVLEEVAEPLMELRALLTCGEALSYETCRLTRSRMGHHFPIVNQYGPTECTMSSTFFVVGDEPASGIVPIGRPIANRKVYVLDRHMCPVPIGTTGEIYIGGVGLARGYLNRPDLTAERFVQNPFGSGDRLYRTGDLGRWRKDGNLEFLGRADHQVKIRGFRIELGEVEAVLLSHPDVRQAVVIAHEDQTGDKRLVAYVVGEASPRDLRAHILNTLPDYMTPAAFVALEAMPLTTNGKIDRAALPHPTNDNGLARADYVAPRTPTEEILAAIWADVLQVSQVGVNDNFFELGGNSLTALYMTARTRHVLAIELDNRTLFREPRLGYFAQIIDRIRSSGDQSTGKTKSAEHASSNRTKAARYSPAPIDGWITSNPETQGLASDVIDDLVEFGRSVDMDSLSIVRHGYLVTDRYFHPFKSGIKHALNSATKSILGSLVGIAIEQRLIQSADDKLQEYLGDFPSANSDKKDITLRHLLDMKSGIDWSEPLGPRRGIPTTADEMRLADDWVDFILRRPMSHRPGDHYNYNSGNSHLISAVITSVAGTSAWDFAQRYLFDPLRIIDTDWSSDPRGISDGGNGLFLHPLDVAKIGYLHLREGRWNSIKILPSGWTDRITENAKTVYRDRTYSTFFWSVPSVGGYMANGYNRQIMLIVPKSDLVVVSTGKRPYPFADFLAHIERLGMVPAKPMQSMSSRADGPPDNLNPALLRSLDMFSRKVYCFPKNSVGLKSLQFDFDEINTCYQAEFDPDASHLNSFRVRQSIGLNGEYSESMQPDGIGVARVRRITKNTIQIEQHSLGKGETETLTVTFHDEQISLRIATSRREYTLTGETSASRLPGGERSAIHPMPKS
ncbi:amino acid adenylation domain-containing protein (plasmid) [Agrobacterium tumefaciens]|uniref:non-ribosomal peptide synthetase n=3 Tax=Agrobacterium tumefaciens TaxID=358 RepID=UPI00234176F2|nr:non-ribosomal peptide synthetase [Agrobacterium tumefaciens]WCA72888.1 amino acid adenylation domain-containing protein [Agrobacterium tumefaciens]